jgi:hypothetical protein
VVAVIRRLRRRLSRTAMGNRRQKLVQDIDRVGLYLSMIRYAADALSAPDTVDAATCIAIWRSWAEKVQSWAEEQES